MSAVLVKDECCCKPHGLVVLLQTGAVVSQIRLPVAQLNLAIVHLLGIACALVQLCWFLWFLWRGLHQCLNGVSGCWSFRELVLCPELGHYKEECLIVGVVVCTSGGLWMKKVGPFCLGLVLVGTLIASALIASVGLPA